LRKEDKKVIIEELQKKLSETKVVIVTDYKGLNVAEINDLRGKLAESNVEYKVVKNTLLKRAAKGTDISLIEESFKGPSAIALSYDDPVAPAKVLTAFATDHEALDIKIGILDGKVLDLNGIVRLSALPSREALLAQLLSVINGVPTSLVRALNDVPRRMLNVLKAIENQKAAA